MKIADYRINLLLPSKIADFGKFKTSVGEVLEVVKASKDKEEMEKVIRENPAFRNLENDAVRAINVFAGISVPVDEKEGATDMCKAWEDQRLEGLEEGLEKTRYILRGLGFSEEEIEKKLKEADEQLSKEITPI